MTLKDDINKAIEEGKVTMKPKWHFVLRGVLLFVGTVLAVLTVVYLISFIFFILQETGVGSLPSFGPRGYGEFLHAFPWLVVLLALIFIIVLEVLVKKYSFAYRKPLLYTTIGVIFLVLVGGFVVAQTSFHRGLFNSAWKNHLPLAGTFYRQYGGPGPHHDNVEIGQITEIKDTGYIITDREEGTLEIIVSPSTAFPEGRDFKVGDSIVVLGNDESEGKVQAQGIKKVPDLPPDFHHEINPARPL